MKNNALAIVGAVFLVLLIGWFATRDSQPRVGIKELKVQKIKADDVVKVVITIPGKVAKKNPAAPDEGPVEATTAPPSTVVLERSAPTAKTFTVSDGKGAKHPVDDAQLKPLLDAIGELNAGDVVANKAEKHKDFEIDDAQGTHVVITTTGGKALDLLFGRAAKGGGTTVREQGSNDVFVAKGRLGTLAKKEAGQWRKKALLDKKAEDFTAVTIARGDGSKVVLAGTSKEEPAPPAVPGAVDPPPPRVTMSWTLTEPSLPAGYRLDESALSRVAAAVATLRATDFADDVDDATAGFVAPHTVVTAKGKDGKDTVLHVGAHDDKKRVHVRVDGDPQVYLVAEYAAKNLDKGLDDLRDLSLFSAKADDVTQLSITAGKTRVLVKREGVEWKLVEPKTPPPEFDANQIGSVVAGALRMKGVRLANGVSDAGPADPVVEIQLANGKSESVRFGKSVVDEAEKAAADSKPKELFVKGADGLVYVVSAFTRSRYEKPTELFKKPAAPPPGMGGGGMQGLDSLPPDIRKKLEASLKAQGLKNP